MSWMEGARQSLRRPLATEHDLFEVVDTADAFLRANEDEAEAGDARFRAGYGLALLNRLSRTSRTDRQPRLPSQRALLPGEFVSYGFIGVKGTDPIINIRERLCEHSAVSDLELEQAGKQRLDEAIRGAAEAVLAPERGIVMHALAKVEDNEIRSNLANAGALRLAGEEATHVAGETPVFADALSAPVSERDAFIAEFIHTVDEAAAKGEAMPLDFHKMVSLAISPAGMMHEKLYLRAPVYVERLAKAVTTCADKEAQLEQMTDEMLQAQLDAEFFENGLPFNDRIVDHLLERGLGATLVARAPRVLEEAGMDGDALFARAFTAEADKGPLKGALANLARRRYVLTPTQSMSLLENGYWDVFFEEDRREPVFASLVPFAERKALYQSVPSSPAALASLAEFVAGRAKLGKELSMPKELAFQLIDAGYIAEALNGQRAKLFEKACRRQALNERLVQAPIESIIAALPHLDQVNLPTEIAEYCIDSGRVAVVAEHIKAFWKLSPKVHEAFVQEGLEAEATEHLARFDGLGADLADRLKASGKTRDLYLARRSFAEFSPETALHLERYGVLLERIENSPSRTVRQMRDALTEQLLSTAEPEKTYEKIERVFLRNHIPLAGKVFLTFDLIYGDTRYEKAYSPTIKDASPREARMLIYKDLINIHLDTGNPSLKSYLQEVVAIMPLVERVKRADETALEDGERLQLEEFFRKLRVLRDVSHYGNVNPEEGVVSKESVQDGIVAWEKSMGVKDGQSIQERLEEMFLRPAGVASVQEALARMDSSAERADTTNRSLVAESGGKLQLKAGDLLKRVKSSFFRSYQQNGNVTKECLGGSVQGDATALDTDTGKVLEKDLVEGNKSALRNSPSNDYAWGDITLVLRPEADRFLETSIGEDTRFHDQLRGKTAPYELFQTPVIDDERHFGIRTGVPFTEVRWIIMRAPGRRELLDLKMDIVANGYYVPITEEDGTVLFSEAEFDHLRVLYAGTDVLPETAFVADPELKAAPGGASLEALADQIGFERPSIEQTQRQIEDVIKGALAKAGMSLRTSAELAIGAEILNTGSTARGTNIPGETVDFDIVLRLDENDLKRQGEIKAVLDEALRGQFQAGGNSQWRRTGVRVGDATVDIDVTFTQKPEVEGVPSHLVSAQRLESLERGDPAQADLVRANIVQAKLALKKAGVYKKLDGGLGGLGVENWILQSGGSFARARKEFLAQAIDEKGEIRPFEACAERYAIPDPGINLIENLDQTGASDRKAYRHDNFFYFLNREKADGYEKMVKALQALE